MIKGIYKFEPFRMNFNGAESFPTSPSLEQISQRFIDEKLVIDNWRTIMNILSFNLWSDPLTGDIHIVLRSGKMLNAHHIGEAAEILK